MHAALTEYTTAENAAETGDAGSIDIGVPYPAFSSAARMREAFTMPMALSKKFRKALKSSSISVKGAA
jgi:hypothetical protein